MARGKFTDLTGMKFGRLTVIERAENKGKNVCWLCKCECGNEKVIMGIHLKSGDTKSCGCLQSEKSSKRMKKQWQDEDFRKMKSERMKQLSEEQWQDEDFRKKQSEKTKKQWQDEDFRKMKSEQMKEQMKKQWQDEDFRKMKSEKTKKQWQDEDFRKKQSEKMKEQMKKQWQDEEMKWKMGYKGGITPISMYLRHLNVQWYEDCKQKANYTCQLTGQVGGQLHTHHLKAFNIIVKEAHDLYGIEVKPQIKDYTDEELKILEKYVASWHKDNSNAVVLCKDVHMLFHQEYGYRNNTPEQYMEFKERYLAGEFKEILK